MHSNNDRIVKDHGPRESAEKIEGRVKGLSRKASIRMFASAIFLYVPLLGAQERTAAFDLPSALLRAQQANLELRAVRQHRALALAGVATARQLPNPTFSFFVARDTPHEGVAWGQPIELGGKRSKRIAVAREEQRAVELDIVALSRQVRRRSREAFYRSLAQRALADQATSAVDLAGRVRDAVRQRYEAGDVAQLEVIQAEVELARADADRQLALASQSSADAELAALLNLPLEMPPVLLGTPDQMPRQPLLADLIATALHSNGELVRTAQDMRTEEARLALARSQKVPNLDLQLGADLNVSPDLKVGPRGQLGVQLPLFYRGQGEVAAANARIELLRLTLEFQRTNTAAAVAAAFYDFSAKRGQAERYRERILPQSVALAGMAEESYRAGKSSLLMLLDAQRRLSDVRRAYLDSLFVAQSSFARLEESVGASLD